MQSSQPNTDFDNISVNNIIIRRSLTYDGAVNNQELTEVKLIIERLEESVTNLQQENIQQSENIIQNTELIKKNKTEQKRNIKKLRKLTKKLKKSNKNLKNELKYIKENYNVMKETIDNNILLINTINNKIENDIVMELSEFRNFIKQIFSYNTESKLLTINPDFTLTVSRFEQG